MNGRSTQNAELSSASLYGLSESEEQLILVAALTFAILFYLKLALDDGNHLCKNHCKRAIPAEYAADGGKGDRPPRDPWPCPHGVQL